MHKVTINGKITFCEDGKILSEVLIDEDIRIPHPCARRGICKKCTVTVNGKEEISCQYRVYSDITVEVQEEKNIISEDGLEIITDSDSHKLCYVLDIGTTTLSLALIDRENAAALKVITEPNPQSLYGADVISRIEICKTYGVSILQQLLIKKLNRMLKQLGEVESDELYVSGNTVMLHIFFGKDCRTLGYAPYTPVFLDAQECNGNTLGLQKINKVYSLPCIASFVGADVTAGLNLVPPPEKGKYSLLVDLGTNAEIVLFSENVFIATSAAAGPCFEGVGIEHGMSASEGAIYEYHSASNFRTVGNTAAQGICSTGLIDMIAVLVRNEIIDETGYMESDKFRITDNVYLTKDDIRHFQTAKSAVYSGITTLMKKAEITAEDIDTLYISGGFAAKMNIDNAAEAGIIPKELKEKCVALKNSCLQGTVKYACNKNDLSRITANARYIDLAGDKDFSESFINNMMFSSD